MKDKAYILDFNLLSEQNLSVEEFIMLARLSNNELTELNEIILNSLEDKQFVKINRNNNNEITLREKSNLLINFVSIESLHSIASKKTIKRSDRAIQAGMIEFVKEYRTLWKGLKPGSMGSEGTCTDKLIKWMKLNPSYSKEDIIKAAKIYLKTVDNYQYLQQADYFIFKKDAFGESSRLSSFIDEIDIKIVEDNWTTRLN
jgi:hypothetical protein|tara:strand:+ start:527 stop:1129 length:603 start_codon:yes stop_codon:yes gene_type:complete